MDPLSLVLPKDDHDREPPDDFADDSLIGTANLDEQDTNVPGTIFASTALGAHGPRVKWYPGRAGRDLPCLILSIGPDPEVRDDVLPPRVSKAALPRLVRWVGLNHVALLRFWSEGASWNRSEVSRFLDRLRPCAAVSV